MKIHTTAAGDRFLIPIIPPPVRMVVKRSYRVNKRRRRGINPAVLFLIATWAGIALAVLHTEGCTPNPIHALK